MPMLQLVTKNIMEMLVLGINTLTRRILYELQTHLRPINFYSTKIA